MQTIKCKPAYLRKLLLTFIIIGLIISILIFAFLKMDISYRYFLAMIIIFFGLLIVFYLNRTEPEKLEIDSNEMKITFFNKVFFKKMSRTFIKQNNNYKLINDMIELFEDNLLIVVIRRNSLSKEDWEAVKNYFDIL